MSDIPGDERAANIRARSMRVTLPRNMRVLFLPGWYPNRTHPNLGNFVQRHAEAVARLHEVVVVYATPDPHVRSIELEERERNGVLEHIAYFRPGTLPVLDRWKSHRRLLARVGTEFDVAHAHVLHASAMMLQQLPVRLRSRSVITEHWTGYHNGAATRLPWPVRWAMRTAAARASRICPVSDHLGDAMQAFGLAGRYTTVPNVVDTDLFRPVARTEQEHVHFLHVSTLVDEQKNISGLLRSFRAALEERPDMVLEILGDGDLAPPRGLATELGIPPSSIMFTGNSPLRVVADRMAHADAFVLFSRWENMPCVILEAFASGTPVIATNVGNIPRELTPERGLLVASEDEPALTRALVDVAGDPGRFDRQALRKHAEDHFSMEHVAHAYDRIYQEIRYRS